MWRRLLSSNLKTLAAAAAAAAPTRSTSMHTGSLISPSASASLFNLRHFTADSADGAVKKRVEDVMPIATGQEFESELEALLQHKIPDFESDSEEELKSESELSVVNYPCGPFGTKEEPAIILSYYDKRIAGCFGGDGRDEHDFVCFWLEKGKPRECPVCPQYFELKVVGPGGPPPPRR